MQTKYKDRIEAGETLALELEAFRKQPSTIILALPRGGVPVAYAVAKNLSLPMDIFTVRKIGVPGYEELAMGAIASGDVVTFNEEIIRSFDVSKEQIQSVINAETQELIRREHAYRGTHVFPDLTDKTVILVDDGIATGATMHTAIEALRKKRPSQIIVAVPVAAADTVAQIKSEVNQVVCPLLPEAFGAVGVWYQNFSQTSDEAVIQYLSSFKNK